MAVLLFISIFLVTRKTFQSILLIRKLLVISLQILWKSNENHIKGKRTILFDKIKNDFIQWLSSATGLLLLLISVIFLLGLDFELNSNITHNSFTEAYLHFWVILVLVGIAIYLYNLARENSIIRFYVVLIPLSIAASSVTLLFGKNPPTNSSLFAIVVIMSVAVIAPLLSIIKPKLIPQVLIIPLCIIFFEGFLLFIFGSYYIRIIEPNLWTTMNEPSVSILFFRIISYGAKCMFQLPEIGIGKPLMPFAAYLIGVILNLVILTFFISIVAGRATIEEPIPSSVHNKEPLFDRLNKLIDSFENRQPPSD